jgi:hypothetical protein
MKLFASFLTLLFVAHFATPQTGKILLPTGERQAERATAQADQNVPPPLQPKRTIDVAKLQQDANELAALAASIPPAVNQTSQGMMPKDLSDKLKHIEKLAKHLRGEINP